MLLPQMTMLFFSAGTQPKFTQLESIFLVTLSRCLEMDFFSTLLFIPWSHFLVVGFGQSFVFVFKGNTEMWAGKWVGSPSENQPGWIQTRDMSGDCK